MQLAGDTSKDQMETQVKIKCSSFSWQDKTLQYKDVQQPMNQVQALLSATPHQCYLVICCFRKAEAGQGLWVF